MNTVDVYVLKIDHDNYQVLLNTVKNYWAFGVLF